MPIKTDREYRSMMLEASDDYAVEGDFSTYDQPYLLTAYDEPNYRIEVWEQVTRGAFDECDVSDVIMQYDHTGRVYARTSNGTLDLDLDETPHMRAMLGGTSGGRNLYDEIKGGYITRMSFGFKVAADERTRTEETVNDKTVIKILRNITKIEKLYDVSAVSIPANDQTYISARALTEEVRTEALEEIKNALERAKAKKRLELRIKLMEVEEK